MLELAGIKIKFFFSCEAFFCVSLPLFSLSLFFFFNDWLWMSNTTYLIPKDLPPSYDSLYQSTPSCSQASYYHDSAIRRFFRKHGPFLQKFTAAVFVAATVSATVMLLLWQLQNLTTSPPPNNDDPWFDPYQEEEYWYCIMCVCK